MFQYAIQRLCYSEVYTDDVHKFKGWIIGLVQYINRSYLIHIVQTKIFYIKDKYGKT